MRAQEGKGRMPGSEAEWRGRAQESEGRMPGSENERRVPPGSGG